MNVIKFTTVVLASLLFTSCAFNNKFHYPSQIPVPIENLPSFDFGKDTVLFDYHKETKLINFFKKDSALINKHFTIESRTFKSKSGNRLNAWMLKPKTKEPKATIIHFHGSAGNLLSQYEAISPLTDYGFQVLTFDYSGYGFSEGKATRKNAFKDAYAFLDFAVNQREVKAKKVILYGQSYGGYLAAVVGSNRQINIDGIVIEGAFTSHKSEAKYEVPFWGNIVKNEKHADHEIRKNKKPVIIIHSKEDQKVPIEFGKKIYDNANQPKEFYEIEKPHILGLQYYAKEIADRIDKLMLQ